jgi:hypothetical protein
MRGSPVLRAVLVFLALLALAPVIWSITRKSEQREEPSKALAPTPNAVPVSKIEGRWTFTTAPLRVAVKHLGSEIWSKSSPGVGVEFSGTMPWPKEGVELQVRVEWPQGTETAAGRLRLVAPDGTEYDRTVWGGTEAEEVLTFP